MRRQAFRSTLLVAAGFFLNPGVFEARADQLRVVNWNVTNYTSGRVTEFETAIYGMFSGRTMAPDVFIGEEFTSASAVTNFLNILNNAPNSPADWAAAPFVDGPDTDSALFYRISKVFLATDLSPNGVTVVATGGVDPNHPRNIMRYDVRIQGFNTAETTIAIYATHMKAGSTATDQARRLVEAERIRDDAELLPAGWHFLIGGDFNIQDSSQAAYQELVGSQVNNDGRFFDPINTPGSWNNNFAFRIVHTQDPSGIGGMDDRLDLILLSDSLIDGLGMDYIGDSSIPYSTITWDDPNHSYRSWGNDGTSFNTTLTVSGNQMVGAVIAQALVDAGNGNGHLPVFLDLVIPDIQSGACCTDCGCIDFLTKDTCTNGFGGDFTSNGLLCQDVGTNCVFPSFTINEFAVRDNQGPNDQDKEFVEIIGNPGDPLCNVSLVNIDGDSVSRGRVLMVFPLDDCGSNGCTINSNGRFVVGGPAVSPDKLLETNLGVELHFQDGTQTMMLVRNPTVVVNDDIDQDGGGGFGNGVADFLPGDILDAVAITDGGSGDNTYYGAVEIGPSNGALAAGAARCPDGADTASIDDWVTLSLFGDGSDGCVAFTPGVVNPAACGGDFDGDGDFDLIDFAAFQSCMNQANASCAALELDGNCGIDLADYDLFFNLILGP